MLLIVLPCVIFLLPTAISSPSYSLQCLLTNHLYSIVGHFFYLLQMFFLPTQPSTTNIYPSSIYMRNFMIYSGFCFFSLFFCKSESVVQNWSYWSFKMIIDQVTWNIISHHRDRIFAVCYLYKSDKYVIVWDIYIYIYIYIYTHTHTHTYIHTHTHIYIIWLTSHTHAYIYHMINLTHTRIYIYMINLMSFLSIYHCLAQSFNSEACFSMFMKIPNLFAKGFINSINMLN